MAINPAVIQTVGSLASSLIGAGGSVAGAGLSFGQQKALQANQADINYQYAEKEARNKPTWNRAGLETAGYNPMLAVQNATSGANASWTSAQSANAPDISGGITQGIANAQSFQRLKNETNTAASQVKANEATAENQSSQAMNNLEENKWISPKRKSEIANIEGDTMLKDAQIKNMEKQIELGFAGIDVQQEANAISAIGKEEYSDKAKRYKEWGEKHPLLRNIDETITRYFNGVGGNIGATKKVK